MDYNPIILAAKGGPQGDFVPTTLGPYDYWVIEYAYKPIDGDEQETSGSDRLTRRRSAAARTPPTRTRWEPTRRTRSIRWSISSTRRPTRSGYFRERFGIVDELVDVRWKPALVKPGDGYQVLRRAIGRGLNEYYRGLLITTKFVGGRLHLPRPCR